MIVFAPLRTRRLAVRLRELPIGDEMALCALPDTAHEKALTEFLTYCVESAETPSDKYIADPRAWSVSERLLVLAHYQSHTRDDAPDYAVTETSRLSDYLDMSRDIASAPSFSVEGDEWTVQPLTGAMAEAIETLQLEAAVDANGHEHWLIGVMAAQLVRTGESPPDAIAEPAQYIEYLRLRMQILRKLPSSVAGELYARFRSAHEEMSQFFRVWIDNQGIIVLPKEAGAPIAPARFLVHSCVSELARALSGKQ
ncbi:hypothetical protein POK33_38245 [Burkholderia cenocepacia]|uniref:hypothetical protein n=1 Tax=Burkholderia cenocepacia TaxID=95486 RepID=UPI0023B8BB7B|nr:hypothetical protein [Burkholderia cenocepacia]MDF0506597.1 hypothetical protein [Burkholderia cenocepacia]